MHMRTRAHTLRHTHRQTLAQMPHRRSASRTRTPSLCCCQIKAWKAGHKGECVAAARDDTRTAAKQTADQMRVLKILVQLDVAADWRGVAAQERAARAVAADVRTSMPSIALAKEVGDRRAGRTGTSATRFSRRGTMRRPSNTTRRTWRLQRRWAIGRGRASRTGTSGARISRWGTGRSPSSTRRIAWRLQRRWAIGRERARRTLTSALATCT